MLDLSTVKVLFRDGTSNLWGMPYELLEGQAPRHLWLARREPELGGTFGQLRCSPGPREGWVWLGALGWWGSYSAEQVGACKQFLSAFDLPVDPWTWGRLGKLKKVLTRQDSAV